MDFLGSILGGGGGGPKVFGASEAHTNINVDPYASGRYGGLAPQWSYTAQALALPAVIGLALFAGLLILAKRLR